MLIKLPVILTSFFILQFHAKAQLDEITTKKVDSIQRIISMTSDDSVKIVALRDWDYLIYQTNPQDDFHINKKIEKICREKLKLKLSKSLRRYYTSSLIYACNGIGGCLKDYGDYKNSLEYHMEALKLSLKIKSKGDEASSYTGLGNVYGDIGNHEKSVEYYRKSYNIHIGSKSFDKAAVTLNNLGIELSYKGMEDSAVYYYRLSLKYTDLKESPYDYSTTLNNIGTIFDEAGKLDSAMSYYERSLEIADRLNYEDNQALVYGNIGNIHLSRKEYDKAEELFLKAEKLAIKTESILYSIDANDGLYSVYQATGELAKAMKCLERKLILTDSVNNEETEQYALQEAFQLDYDRMRIEDSLSIAKQKEISDLKLKSKNEELENAQNRQIILYGGIGSIFIFAGFMYNRVRVTRKQKGIIEEQKVIVEEKQKEILDSITYAKRIQKAIFPSQKSLQTFLPNHFVLYRPKDIVAGDFYWMEKTDDRIFLAACDCTGHGVPGAMVSVVCHNALNRAVREYGLTDTGEILDKTRELVISEFEKSEEDVNDGMDISIVSFVLEKDKSIGKLNWSGANNPLWILREGKMLEWQADKQPIGRYVDAKGFQSNTLEIRSGDIVYLFTDGYADQFGGEKGKKLKYSNFQKILIGIHQEPMNTQASILNVEFDKWKGNLEQIDDVCIIGIRI